MEYLEVARASSGPPRHSELVLRERHDPDAAGGPVALELRVNGVYVMDTLQTGSEEALARIALSQVPEPRAVVVAGLGLGFTAHEVLRDRRVERVTVVEVEEALVGWLRDGTVPSGPRLLADERLHVVIADIRQAVAEAAVSSYDLVLLDVDNGPGQLVHEGNEEVYRSGFLGEVARLLRPGGVVAVWSAAESADLAEALREVFGAATAVPHEVALQGREERYWLYLAHRSRDAQR